VNFQLRAGGSEEGKVDSRSALEVNPAPAGQPRNSRSRTPVFRVRGYDRQVFLELLNSFGHNPPVAPAYNECAGMPVVETAIRRRRMAVVYGRHPNVVACGRHVEQSRAKLTSSDWGGPDSDERQKVYDSGPKRGMPLGSYRLTKPLRARSCSAWLEEGPEVPQFSLAGEVGDA
jgi:hypothetical protein